MRRQRGETQSRKASLMSGAKLQGGLNSEMETDWATSKGFGQDKIGTGVSPAVRGREPHQTRKENHRGKATAKKQKTARDGETARQTGKTLKLMNPTGASGVEQTHKPKRAHE